jgi:hypothetical protein
MPLLLWAFTACYKVSLNFTYYRYVLKVKYIRYVTSEASVWRAAVWGRSGYSRIFKRTVNSPLKGRIII